MFKAIVVTASIVMGLVASASAADTMKAASKMQSASYKHSDSFDFRGSGDIKGGELSYRYTAELKDNIEWNNGLSLDSTFTQNGRLSSRGLSTDNTAKFDLNKEFTVGNFEITPHLIHVKMYEDYNLDAEDTFVRVDLNSREHGIRSQVTQNIETGDVSFNLSFNKKF